MSTTRISRITVARLYNLGNYEHVRYELTVDVAEGDSAATALKNITAILHAMSPKPPVEPFAYQSALARLNAPEKAKDHFIYIKDEDNRAEAIKAQADEDREIVTKMGAFSLQRKKAIEALDDLGGTTVYKDDKLNWEDAQ